MVSVKPSILINPNSIDNKGSWRILKDFYCSVKMLRELGLKESFFSFLEGDYEIDKLCPLVA